MHCSKCGADNAISAVLQPVRRATRPKEWRETVAAYHSAAAEPITRFGGHVAKYLGDGVLAYPEGHDNDAERAVRAGQV